MIYEGKNLKAYKHNHSLVVMGGICSINGDIDFKSYGPSLTVYMYVHVCISAYVPLNTFYLIEQNNSLNY